MALTKVSTDGVKDDAITKAKIPANQIEASELADNAVDTNAIASNAVTNGKLADNAITSAKIADSSVTNSKLGDDSVTGSRIADNAVATEHITNGSVTEAKIAGLAITQAKIANGAVGQNQLATGAVLTAKIADGNVTAAKLASGVGGKLLQTVNATTSSQVENTTGSYYDTNLSANITLTAANKVLIFVAQQLEARQYNATGFSVGRLKLVRTTSGSSSDVFAGGRSVVTSGPGSGSWFIASGCIASIIAEDSPGVGTHNYKTRIARIVGGGGTAVRANSDGHSAEIILMEVAQ